MARDYVRDRKAVIAFNKEVDAQAAKIDQLDGKWLNVAASLETVATTLQGSNKYSQNNLDIADNQAKVGQEILVNMTHQEGSGWMLKKVADMRFKAMVKSLDVEEEVAKNMLEQYELEKKKNKEKEKEVNLSEEVADALERQVPFGKELKTIFAEKEKSGKKWGAALVIVGALLKTFTGMTKVIGDNFGSIGMKNQEFKDGMLEASVSATNLGLGIEDVAASVNSLTSNFGFSLQEAVGMTEAVLDTSKAIGLSTEEGAQLIGVLSQVGMMSTETANQFAKQAALLAESAGVAPAAVMKDIANSSEAVAKFTSGSGENIAKAAIMATKLGTNLNTVAAVAEGLLDFQSSLSKEIEAQIVTGKQLNYQKARELALNNDIEGAMAEIVGQLGSQEEFLEMNAIQRKALADSIGVSVDQLAKFVKNEEKAKTLQDSIAEQDTWEDLVGEDSLDAIAKVMADFKAIGAELAITIGPMLSSIMSVIAGITGWLQEAGIAAAVLGVIMGAMVGKAVLNFVLAIGTALGKSAGWMGPLGVALVLAIPAIIGGILASTMSKGKAGANETGDFMKSGDTTISTRTPGGMKNFNMHKSDDILAAPGIAGMMGSRWWRRWWCCSRY